MPKDGHFNEKFASKFFCMHCGRGKQHATVRQEGDGAVGGISVL